MGELVAMIIIIAVVNWAKQQAAGSKEQKHARKQTSWQTTERKRYYSTDTLGQGSTGSGAQLSLEDMLAQARKAASGMAETVNKARRTDAEKPAPVQQAKARPQKSGSMDYDSSEGRSTEGNNGILREITSHSDGHVVRPFTESSHIHMESTAMDGAECQPDKAPAPVQEVAQPVSAPEMPDIRQAIIWSEIIGKPKALRR